MIKLSPDPASVTSAGITVSGVLPALMANFLRSIRDRDAYRDFQVATTDVSLLQYKFVAVRQEGRIPLPLPQHSIRSFPRHWLVSTSLVL